MLGLGHKEKRHVLGRPESAIVCAEVYSVSTAFDSARVHPTDPLSWQEKPDLFKMLCAAAKHFMGQFTRLGVLGASALLSFVPSVMFGEGARIPNYVTQSLCNRSLPAVDPLQGVEVCCENHI
jgi:hypothetical protein